jgi:hypothetical protein
VQLLCIGDVAFGSHNPIMPVWDAPPGMTPGEEERILFNWELPIGTVINPIPRSSGPRIIAHPDSPRIIRNWAPGFAALATNHILDAGKEGLANTLHTLQQEGFTTLGAGLSSQEIKRPLIWATAEGKLAVVNWVFPEAHPDWMSIPGPNCWPGIEEAKNVIRDLRTQADWVIVLAHWSDELFPYPRPEDREIAYELAMAGADMLIGHHPHVVRGMELIAACPVFYSLGNFYFSNVADSTGAWIEKQAPRNREALAIWIRFTRGMPPEYQPRSFWQKKDCTVADPLHRAVRRMEYTSRPLQHFKGKEYEEWYSAKRAQFDRIWGRWHFGVRRLGLFGLMQRFARGLGSGMFTSH